MFTDLSKCEEEQIHIPNKIQPYGFVIVFDKQTQIITRCSKNIEDTFLGSTDKILGRYLRDIIPYSIFREIEKKLDFSTQKKSSLIDIAFPAISLHTIDIMLCESKDEVILEMIPSRKTETNTNEGLVLNQIIKKVLITPKIEDLFSVVVDEIQKITHYDRVMIYCFDEDFNGEVIAEVKDPSLESYLHLHYPASDIPTQARELYCKNMIRVITDVNYQPVPIIDLNTSVAKLDMSYSHLRSVSPVHLEYLKNMGVGATLTISIMVNQKLWGLISCHHRSPYLPGRKSLNIAEIFGNILGGIIQMRQENEREKRSSELLARLDILMDILLSQDKNQDVLNLIQNKAFLFQSIFPSDGFLVYMDGKIASIRFPFLIEEVQQLIASLELRISQDIFITDSLVSILPNLPEKFLSLCAGLMVLRLDTNPRSYWIWRRAEKTQTISWGGDPNQKAIINQQGKISPRKSFEKYNQIVTHKSIVWDRTEKELSVYLVPQIYRLFEFFESSKKIISHQNKIKSMEQEKERHYEELIEMLVGVIEQRDAYTAGHTRRVAEYCVAIATELHIDDPNIARLKEAAILHDIGKVIIPDSILLKPGRLSNKEYELIKLHLNVGYEILDKIDYYKPLAEIIKYHHEKFDGSGYPYHKKGDEIPILSHIMIVADALDAMTTNRIYQSRKTMEEAVAEIVRYKGSWYHPNVVDATVISIQNMKNIGFGRSQFPFTQLERERFAYFFKDQLTGLYYNETYLWMGIKEIIPDFNFHHLLLIELHGMSEFNKYNGWHQGNLLIQMFSEALLTVATEEQLYRVFGDCFVIGFGAVEERKEFLLNWKPIQFSNVYASCKIVEKNLFLDMY